MRPGVAGQEIDRAARRGIADAGYGEYFIHRVGHSIGLTTHEPPYMVEGETHPIEPSCGSSREVLARTIAAAMLGTKSGWNRQRWRTRCS